MKQFLKNFYGAWKILASHEPLILSSSTAFFAVFAVPSIVVIIIAILGTVLKPALVGGELLARMEVVFGAETSEQFGKVVNNMQQLGGDWKVTAFSIAIFLISSTTMFLVIQKSVNLLWKIRPRPQSKVLNMLKSRVFALLVILAGGIILLLTVLLEMLIAYMSGFVDSLFGMGILLFEIMGLVLALLASSLWFALIFKFLPDAKVKWKPVWIGAILTSVLFMAGIFILRWVFLGRLDDWWGDISSVVLVLVFLFYVSTLFYYGAAFIRAYVEAKGDKISPASYATLFNINEK